MEYLYLFKVKDEDSTYKIGKTKRHYMDRLSEYNNIENTIGILPVQDADISERHLMNHLNKLQHVKRRRDLGLEYYEGDILRICDVFNRVTSDDYQNHLCIPMKFDITCDDCHRAFCTIGGLKTHKRHCKANMMVIG